jgi:hypothetical protein
LREKKEDVSVTVIAKEETLYGVYSNVADMHDSQIAELVVPIETFFKETIV